MNLKIMKKLLSAAALAAAVPGAFAASPLDGLWDGVLEQRSAELPFKIEFSGEGENFKGSFHNGDQKVESTSGKLESDGSFVLNFDHYLTRLEGTLKDGKIEGKFANRSNREGGGVANPIHAVRHKDAAANGTTAANVPTIDGLWEIPVESPKGEKSWRFIVHQKGAEVSASILRVDGDTGTLSGTFKDGRLILTHFDGTRPLWLKVVPKPDGTLAIEQRGRQGVAKDLVAYRPEAARAKGLPEPSDLSKHTTIKKSDEVFKFSFPDVDGRTISNTDERFKNKVVVAVVTGTWCPNCHDEAQFLVELHRKYRDKGLEIVALDFEEIEEQDAGYKRVRSFVKKYGVQYPYLIAGAPIEMWVKVPQADNLNSWPTTFFIGKDGRVKQVHSGFASPASGDFHKQVRETFTSTVEKLLAENNTASR